MNDKNIRVSFVGAGSIAREHLRAFASLPGVELAGICSRTRNKAEELSGEFGIPGVYDSIGDMYESTQSQLVVITVSIPSIAEVTEACLKYAWTLLMEKPPGRDLAQALELQQASAANGRQVLVALNRRFYSSTQAVMADIAQTNGPRFIHVQDQEDLRAAEAAGQPRSVLDRWMYANSIHLIDYFHIFCRGAVSSVTPLVGSETDFVTAAAIVFESGDTGLYQCLWNRPGPWSVSVSLPRKRWEMRPLESACFQTDTSRALVPAEIAESDRQFKPGFLLQAKHAIAAVRGEPHASTTLADAVKTMRLIHSIYARGDAGECRDPI